MTYVETINTRPGGFEHKAYPGQTVTYRLGPWPDDAPSLDGRTFELRVSSLAGDDAAIYDVAIGDDDTLLIPTTAPAAGAHMALLVETTSDPAQPRALWSITSGATFQTDASETEVGLYLAGDVVVQVPLAVFGAAFTRELLQDLFGATFADTATIDATYDDDANVFRFTVKPGSIGDTEASADLARQAALVAHLVDTIAAHAASSVAFTPAGTVAATDVQAAIVEVATEAAAALSAAITGLVGGAPSNGDSLGDLHTRLAAIEAIGSLATDAELIAAIVALIGGADPDGDTLGELRALINTRIPASTLTTDGDLLTRIAGVPARITRAALAADPAFTGAYSTLDGAGDLAIGGVKLTEAAFPDTLARDAEVAAGYVARGVQVIDVRDVGVIGDGASHPLSARFGSLGAAQAVYPAALALTDEEDWAAMQSASNAHPAASFLVHASVHAITNRPVAPTDYSTWTVDGVIENIWPRNTPSTFQDRANVFRVGNIHPWILNSANAGAWTIYALNDITRGQRTVTVTTPAGLALAVGAKVIVRSDTNPVDAGSGRLYDFVQINKVVAYNPGTGVLTLELPIAETIGAAATLTGPKLCVNAGSDPANGEPWWFLDGWELKGRGRVIGGSPFGYKMAAWRCHGCIEGDCQDLISGQAAVKSRFEVRGTFTNRLLEVKMAAWYSEWIADGVFVPDATITPLTTISIGEQATGNRVDVTCHRGTEHTANVRMLEEFGIGNRVRATLSDFSTGGQSEVVAVKSTSHLGRPPSDLDLDLAIRAGTGKNQYLLIGNDPNSDTLFNDADPRRICYRMNALTVVGAAPTFAVQVVRNGGNIVQAELLGDAIRVVPQGVGIEVPENASILVATITGAPTYAAGSETLLGTYTLTGPKLGDEITVSLQPLLTPTSGTFSDLVATAVVNQAATIRVYVRNRSATGVVMPVGSAFFVYVAWRRRRA